MMIQFEILGEIKNFPSIDTDRSDRYALRLASSMEPTAVETPLRFATPQPSSRLIRRMLGIIE
jgi:hypothetical protein